MGLIQRVIEASGIPTISVTLSKEITAKVNPPRAVYTGMPLGHPLGYPGQSFRQLQILRILLNHAKSITRPGTLVDLDLSEDDDSSVSCTACAL